MLKPQVLFYFYLSSLPLSAPSLLTFYFCLISLALSLIVISAEHAFKEYGMRLQDHFLPLLPDVEEEITAVFRRKPFFEPIWWESTGNSSSPSSSIPSSPSHPSLSVRNLVPHYLCSQTSLLPPSYFSSPSRILNNVLLSGRIVSNKVRVKLSVLPKKVCFFSLDQFLPLPFYAVLPSPFPPLSLSPPFPLPSPLSPPLSLLPSPFSLPSPLSPTYFFSD